MLIEKAIFTNAPEKHDIKGFDRIYFGNEFCEENIMNVEKIKKIISIDKKLTFVTPYLTNKGIERIKEILNIIPKKTEVVFNDYGLLKYLEDFTPIFGRILNKQKRGPRILEMKLTNKAKEYYQSSNIEMMEKFLFSKNVKRAEICNVIHGFKIKTKMKLSLYYPYVYVSTTRLCNMNNVEDLSRKKLKVDGCNHECLKYTLYNDAFAIKMILKGNTQFYENFKIPKRGYDRLVYIPEIIL